MVVNTFFEYHFGHPQEVDGFFRVVKESKSHVIAIETMKGCAI
jgi:hypothetical protein